MSLSKVWVYAEGADGKPTSLTLELLTKARDLGGTVEAFYAGADVAAVAPTLGAYGAAKVYATSDLSGALPGPAVAAAMVEQIASQSPDLVMFGMTYEARDVMGRLSVKIDRPVLTNSIDVSLDGSSVRCTTAIFGGNTLVTTSFSGGGPALAAFRPKSFAAEEGGAG
ncbi:MAG TPA: electron transfer flavoprotein subunit alpha/FixB family protein, partial [Acidimicrobiales bacterium]|nr:electron transfer flavoprotein subunit alpha/FixB family protein [Acidimicrobiales bacterium]